jgi:hypothetical protein
VGDTESIRCGLGKERTDGHEGLNEHRDRGLMEESCGLTLELSCERADVGAIRMPMPSV